MIKQILFVSRGGYSKNSFYSIFLSIGKHLKNRKFVNMRVLHGMCYSLVPFCINYRDKEQQYQKEISLILKLELPAIMTKFNKSRVNPQPHGRYKICVSTLTGILFDGVNAFVNHKKAFSPSRR